MARMTFALVLLAAAACSSSTSNIGKKSDAGTGGASGAAGAAGASVGGSGGVKDSGTDAPGPCATTKTVMAALIADASIIPEGTAASVPPGCEVTITQGSYPVMSVGAVSPDNASRILLRFALDGATATAVSAGKVASGKLTLFREMSNGCSGKCPAQAGPIDVFPLTSKWVEGTESGKGANWCWADRENKALPWGAYGANKAGVDHGEHCGQAQADATSPSVSFDLDPKPLMSWVDTQDTLSLMLVSGGAKLFAYTKESSAKKPATLALEVCE